MFDFAWTEIGLIGVVALIAIGPKDLPVAIKAVAATIKKARRMAGEFQTHVDEMVREANLHEVRDQFNELRRMDIKGKILNAVDDDGTIRKSMSEPAMDFSPPPPPVPVHDSAVHDTVAAELAIPMPAPDPAPEPVIAVAPAFLPPGAKVPGAPPPKPPAFIPPAQADLRAHA